MITISRLGQWLLGAGVAGVLTGCASVSVEQGTELAVPQMPAQIYVLGFEVVGGTWNVDRQGSELEDFKQNLRSMLTTGITNDITNKLLLPSSSVTSLSQLGPQNAWLVTGQFVRVNQGSRLLRATIGLGAGGTKLETIVKVYDLQNGYRDVPFLIFATTGGSGATPGAAESLGLIGAAIKAVAGSAKGLTPDTARTARMITAELSQYMFQSGWIPESRYIKPKDLNSY